MAIEMIFFDAGGTLFDVCGSVGEIYSATAVRYGIEIAPERLQRAFVRHFRAHEPPLAFPRGLSAMELQRQERAWWFRLVSSVFAEFGAFDRMDEFFDDVYEVFEKKEAWQLFDDVVPTLAALGERGLRLAVISNFDSRLDKLLEDFELTRFFEAIHISSRIGAAKPDPLIFQTALQYHNIVAKNAVHIGDNLDEDAAGAAAAGLHAVWLDRSLSDKDICEPVRINRLTHLLLMLDRK